MPILKILGRLSGYEKSLRDARDTTARVIAERDALLRARERLLRELGSVEAEKSVIGKKWSQNMALIAKAHVVITKLRDQIYKLGGTPCE